MRRARLLAVLLTLVLAVALPPGLAVGESLYRGFPTALLLVDNQFVLPDVPAINVDGRVLVPVRAIAEAFGAQVDYNAEARTVIISGSPLHRIASLEAENQRLRALVAATGVQPANGPIVISQVSARVQSRHTSIIGVARNTGASAHSVILVASVAESGGKLAAVATGSVANLAAGEGRPFELLVDGVLDLTGSTVTVQVDTLLPGS